MKLFKRLNQLVWLVFFLPALANADIVWNGFLSVGGGIADPDEGEALLEYEDVATFDNETVVGIQAGYKVNDKVDLTVQLLAKGDNDFDPKVSWANISYKFTDNLTLKFGRFQTPLYLYSDYLDVGYAYHWVSPPSELYLGRASSEDGFDLQYKMSISQIDLTAEYYYGSSNEDFEIQGAEVTNEVRKQTGLVGTAAYDWMMVRASMHQSTATIDGFTDIQTGLPAPVDSFSNIIATLNALPPLLVGPGASQAAEDLAFEDVKFTYKQFAVKLEPGNFLFVGEFTNLSTDSGPVGESDSWYVSGGYTFGDWMVHLTHAEKDSDPADLTSGIPSIVGVTDGLILLLDGLAGGFATNSETDTIGVRWDFTTGVALKLEYSDIETPNDPFNSGNLFRFVVDAVF